MGGGGHKEGSREGGLSSIINSAGCLIFDFNCLHKDNGSEGSFCEYSNSHTNSYSYSLLELALKLPFTICCSCLVLLVVVFVLVARKVHQGIKSRPRTASRLVSTRWHCSPSGYECGTMCGS